jgi:ATP-dependent 26S proteasome regulatory subunit
MSGRGRGGGSERGRGNQQYATLSQLALSKEKIQDLQDSQEEVDQRVRVLETSMTSIPCKSDIMNDVVELLKKEVALLKQEMQQHMVYTSASQKDLTSTGGYRTVEEFRKETKRVEALLCT